jgi:hypothetical protein
VSAVEKATKLILAIVCVGLFLGIVFSPFAMVVAGFALWVLLWLGQGGMAEGNPYKRMMGGKVPSFALVNEFQKNEEIEIRDAGSAYTAMFFFGAGAILIIMGVVWMWFSGAL